MDNKTVNVVVCNTYNEGLILKDRLLNKYDDVEVIFDVDKYEGEDVSDKTLVAYVA